LNLSCVQRLKNTWKGLSVKTIALLKEIEVLMDGNFNFRTYRSHLKTCTPPILPFQGVYLSDLTFLEENPDTINGLVNFEKMALFTDIVRDIYEFQETAYPFKLEPSIRSYLLDGILVMNEKALFKGSKKCEPSSQEAPQQTAKKTTTSFSFRKLFSKSPLRVLVAKRFVVGNNRNCRAYLFGDERLAVDKGILVGSGERLLCFHHLPSW